MRIIMFKPPPFLSLLKLQQQYLIGGNGEFALLVSWDQWSDGWAKLSKCNLASDECDVVYIYIYGGKDNCHLIDSLRMLYQSMCMHSTCGLVYWALMMRMMGRVA